jgi:AAA+ ATPase superfamily predicted ATPase
MLIGKDDKAKGGKHMFVGRKKELATLERLYQSNQFECAVIYGRRRIGKTTLINKFVEDKKVIYYTGIQATEQENLLFFSQAIGESLGISSESSPIYANFNQAFKAIAGLATQEKIVLIIDEYPYLAESYPAISSILQQYIDLHFKGKTQLKIVLCGSSMSFMKEQVLGAKSPLFGRRTANFEIKPFSFHEAKELLPHFSAEELFTMYAITGGIPQYLSFMDDSKSVKENIMQHLLDVNGYLYEEPENLLKQELRDPSRYNAIIRAIAEGSSRQNEIATKVQISTSTLTGYLEKLSSLGIVEKLTPITEKGTRKTIYKICDGLFRFWYSFIPKYRTLLERGMAESVWKTIESQLSDFLGPSFEELSIEWLWRKNAAGQLPFLATAIGSWWGTNNFTRQQEEIDIVATDGKQALFGECKYRNSITRNEVVEKLRSRAGLFPQLAVRDLYVFTKVALTPTTDDIQWVNLQMIYEEIEE